MLEGGELYFKYSYERSHIWGNFKLGLTVIDLQFNCHSIDENYMEV